MKTLTYIPIIGVAAMLSIVGVPTVSAQSQTAPPAAQQGQQSQQSPNPQQSPHSQQAPQPSTGSGGTNMQGMEHGRHMQQGGMQHGRGMQGMEPKAMEKEQQKN